VLRGTSATYTLIGKTATTANVTRHAYDALDRLSRVTDPMQRVTSAVGRVLFNPPSRMERRLKENRPYADES